MICREGKVAGGSFLFGLVLQLLGVSENGEKLALLLSESIFTSVYWLFLLYALVLIFVLSISFKSNDFQVMQMMRYSSNNPLIPISIFQIAIRAGLLGYLFGISLYISFIFDVCYRSFGIYLGFLTIFHFSEYFVISISNPESLSLDSFILNHSVQYGLAAALSWVEFFTEVYFYPGESSPK